MTDDEKPRRNRNTDYNYDQIFLRDYPVAFRGNG